jgi:hypothetical protein
LNVRPDPLNILKMRIFFVSSRQNPGSIQCGSDALLGVFYRLHGKFMIVLTTREVLNAIDIV